MKTAEYLTIIEAAESLGVHDQSIRQAIWQGRLASVRMYGRVLVPRKDLEAYRARTRPDGVKPRGRPKGSKGK